MLFTIDFIMKELMLRFQNVIPNSHLVIELLDLVLKSSLLTLNGNYFQQFVGISMGTSIASI